ncbi:MAG: acyl-CoA thioesterase [Bacteroidetes bacterium]|nr:acyl-CoA thioesterase [Bacteroidota bacterium]
MKHHRTQIQLRFKDLDKLGHVNNANYLTYFELARVNFFKAVMGTKTIDWSTEGIIMAKVELTFKQPILLEDEVFVYVWVSRFGTKSFDMNCSIVKSENGQETEVATGMTVLVCINYKTNQTIEIPPLWKQKMEAFQAG